MAGSIPSMENLTQRLDRLERANRSLKRVGAAVALGIAAVALMGQVRTAGRVVEAEQFVLRDTSGKTRGGLAVRPDGRVLLGLADKNGEDRAEINVLPDGSAVLALTDQDRKAGAALYVRHDRTVGLNLLDQNGKHRVEVTP